MHGVKGMHLITLACAHIILHDQYALYEQIWKSHPLCMLLNMFSYTSFLMSVFVSLLVTYLRMIACVYPFKLSKISLPQPILSILIFLCVSFGISYMPYSGIIFSHIDEPQLTLGLGLIPPIMKHGHYTWSLLGYVVPVAVMLFMFSVLQLACIRALTRQSKMLNRCSMTPPHRRRPLLRCVAMLILPLFCQMPLLLLHLASMFGAVLSTRVAFTVTVLVLNVHSVIRAVEHVGITPDFISYILKEKKKKVRNE